MTIEKAFQVLIAELTDGRNYKKTVKDFEKWVETKDRTTNYLNYFLVFDIDHRDFKKRSEYDVTYNQIVLLKANIPPKRDKGGLILYKHYNYKEKEPE